LQNRLAGMKEIIEPCLDQVLNDDEIKMLIKKSFLNYLKIKSLNGWDCFLFKSISVFRYGFVKLD